ncbi:hypothetical protein Peur_041531 [Populus x canadensis]
MERQGRNYYLRGLGFSVPLPLNSQLYITREAAELEAAAGLTRITLSAYSPRFSIQT